MAIKLTSSEEITTKQMLEFIQYINSEHSGSREEAHNTLERAIELLSHKNETCVALLDSTVSIAAMAAMLVDESPAIMCWVLGFMMGVKFSNKELVDKELATLGDGE